MHKIFYHLIPIVYEGGYFKEIYVKAEIQLFNFYLKNIYIYQKHFLQFYFFCPILLLLTQIQPQKWTIDQLINIHQFI